MRSDLAAFEFLMIFILKDQGGQIVYHSPKFKAWSTYSPTGRDTNYYKTRNEITFDITYSTDKKFTLTINNKATDYANYSYDMTLNGITIMVGKGISNFTIKEFSVVKI